MKRAERKPNRPQRVSAVALGACLVSLMAPGLADGAGYATQLPKRVNEAFLKTPLSGGGTLWAYIKTNRHGQITQLIPSEIIGLVAKCAAGENDVLSTEDGGSVLGANAAGILAVGASGKFTYKQTFDDTQITATVTGHFSNRGTRVSGTVVLVNGTPGELGGSTGCTLQETRAYSSKLHWTKFI
jgi:hypothetical protein